MRIGYGYDAHRLAAGRKLVLGGAVIPFDKGLLAHSDGDVLIHAIIDAILGALGEGDIGKKFPDSNIMYKNISSMYLLKEVSNTLHLAGYHIVNIDSTIVAQEPKMSSYINEMKLNISKTLNTKPELVNIKATTEEGLGYTGKGEGIFCHAVCLIDNI